MKYTEADIISWVKSNWKCSHRYIQADGHCSKCGCAKDGYVFQVSRGTPVYSALDGFAFVVGNRLVWYEEALYRIGLLEDPDEEKWQSINVMRPK